MAIGGGERRVQHAEDSAHRHDQRKCDRQQPDRRRAQLRAPKSHGDHGDEMIDPGEGVKQAAQEAAGDARLLMREGRRRDDARQSDQTDQPTHPHVCVPSNQWPPRAGDGR
jgi:hypothetical protein